MKKADAVEANKAEMALYADQSIRKELLQLSSQIWNISHNEKLQTIDFSNREAFESNQTFKAVKQAKSILLKMRKDIAA